MLNIVDFKFINPPGPLQIKIILVNAVLQGEGVGGDAYEPVPAQCNAVNPIPGYDVTILISGQYTCLTSISINHSTINKIIIIGYLLVLTLYKEIKHVCLVYMYVTFSRQIKNYIFAPLGNIVSEP